MKVDFLPIKRPKLQPSAKVYVTNRGRYYSSPLILPKKRGRQCFGVILVLIIAWLSFPGWLSDSSLIDRNLESGHIVNKMDYVDNFDG